MAGSSRREIMARRFLSPTTSSHGNSKKNDPSSSRKSLVAKNKRNLLKSSAYTCSVDTTLDLNLKPTNCLSKLRNLILSSLSPHISLSMTTITLTRGVIYSIPSLTTSLHFITSCCAGVLHSLVNFLSYLNLKWSRGWHLYLSLPYFAVSEPSCAWD